MEQGKFAKRDANLNRFWIPLEILNSVVSVFAVIKFVIIMYKFSDVVKNTLKKAIVAKTQI